MPIFEFHCQKCDKTFERLVFRSDEAVECPDCGEQSVNKLMSSCAAKVGHKFTATSSKSKSAGSSCSGCSATSCSSCG
jgi:putative FmdB family regulatory protein